ncbi:hypothetical protein GGI07_001704 [Coemansia sp. Benny D115]|nr:hypothetical protein GGI07_001704 [Coemansia sp. Benny D115]
MSVHSFKISYKGASVDFASANDETLGELRERISETFGVAPQNQKLLLRGLLADNAQLVRSLVPPNSRIVLVGTASKELDQLHEHIDKREEGRRNHARFRATSLDVQKTGSIRGDLSQDTQYTFHAFETLPNLNNRQAALSMLQRLEKDEGVRQIMRKREYSVGVLRELHPNERTILGYNRNRGEVIALRLRTDDLEGFRSYESVREVLMHELAHMVWDEHDERFHSLNREHCREVIQLNWTLRGQSVGGSRGQRYYEPPREEDAVHVDGGSLKADGFVLGGKAPSLHDDGQQDTEEDAVAARRTLAYDAWKRRAGQR